MTGITRTPEELELQKEIGLDIIAKVILLDPNLAMAILEQAVVNLMFISLGHVPNAHIELGQQVFDAHQEFLVTQIKLIEKVLPK